MELNAFKAAGARIPVLNGSGNYQQWARVIEAVLQSDYKVWRVVTGEKSNPGLPKTLSMTASENEKVIFDRQETAYDDWRSLDARATSYIIMHCNAAIQESLSKETTAKGKWELLQRLYKSRGISHLVKTQGELNALRSSNCKTIEDYCNKFINLSNDLLATEAACISHLLLSINFIQQLDSKHMDDWVARQRSRISAFSDAEKVVGFNNLLSELAEQAIEESRLQTVSNKDSKRLKDEDTKSTALYGKGKGKGNDGKGSKSNITCPTCNNKGHNNDNCYYLHPEKAHDAWKPRDKLGKFKNADLDKGNTYKSKDNKGTKGNDARSVVMFAQRQDDAYAFATKPMSLTKDWIVDSGATDHMCNDISLFSETINHETIIKQPKGQLHSPAIGKVPLRLRTSDGEVKGTLTNVLYVPQLCANLFSIVAADKQGLYWRSDTATIHGKVSHKEKARCIRGTHHWVLDADNIQSHTALSTQSKDSDLDLWHRRMGHVSQIIMEKTAKTATGVSLKTFHDDEGHHHLNCNSCSVCKSTRHVSRIQQLRHEDAFGLLHLDTVTAPVESAEGNKYIINIIDDASRTHFVEFFPSKDSAEISRRISKFIEKIERQLDLKVKSFRTDNGTEFNDLHTWCESHGLTFSMAVAYTPEQNGVVERGNRYLGDLTRTMIHQGKLPQSLWEHAYRTAVHIVNRTFTRSVEDIPINKLDKLLGKDREPADLSHLKVYGCRAYVTIPKERRQAGSKFMARAYVGKLVGYGGDKSSIYYVWVPERGGVVKATHVTFDESTIDSPAELRSHTAEEIDVDIDESQNILETIELPRVTDADDEDSMFADFNYREADTTSQYVFDHESSDVLDEPGLHTRQDSSSGQESTESTDLVNFDDFVGSPNPIVQSPNPQGRRGDSIFNNLRNSSSESDSPAPSDVVETVEPTDNIETAEVDNSSLPSIPDRLEDEDKVRDLAPSVTFGPRRSGRSRTTPVRYGSEIAQFAHAFMAAAYLTDNETDPNSYKEAVESPEVDKWKAAMAEEYAEIKANDTYELVPPEQATKVLDGRWVFKTKRGSDGEILRYKARFVVKGFLQQYGVDYTETFASVVHSNTFKLIFALVAKFDLECEQMDAVTAFLNGKLNEDIYVKQPEGCEVPGKENWVCHLKKTLYGLKQSPRGWLQTVQDTLGKQGFKASAADPCLFIRGDVWILVYVDDFLIVAPTTQQIAKVKADLSKAMKMKDLGPVSYFLGLKIERNRQQRTLRMSQTAYIEKLLKEWNLGSSNVRDTPMSKGLDLATDVPEGYMAPPALLREYQTLIGYVMYAAVRSRPDISFTASVLARFMSKPQEKHLKAGKHLLRYLQGSKDLALIYDFSDCKESKKLNILGYADASWAEDTGSRRSHSGQVFTVGIGHTTPILWTSSLQPLVTLSSCEAELVQLTKTTQEAMWLQALLGDLGYHSDDKTPMLIYEDNKGAEALSKNPEFHKRTKHIGVRHFFCRDAVKTGKVNIQYLPTVDMKADGFTKPFDKAKHLRFIDQLGMKRQNAAVIHAVATATVQHRHKAPWDTATSWRRQ